MDTIFLEYLKENLDIYFILNNEINLNRIYNLFKRYCHLIKNTYNYIQKEYYENISDETKEKQKYYLEKELMDVVIGTKLDYDYDIADNQKEWYRFLISDKKRFSEKFEVYTYYQFSSDEEMTGYKKIYYDEDLHISQYIPTISRMNQIKNKHREKVENNDQIITMVLDEFITNTLLLKSRLNNQDIFHSSIWKNSFKDIFLYDENKISIDRLINFYLNTVKNIHKKYLNDKVLYGDNKEIWRQKEKELLKQTYTKKITLDNKCSLRIFLKHDYHDCVLKKENLTRDDIVIMLEYCGNIYFGEVPENKRFLSYKTNIKNVEDMFGNENIEFKQDMDSYIIAKRLKEEKNKKLIEEKSKRIEEITYELATLKKERSILLNKQNEDRIKIEERDLFEEINGVRYIKDKYKNNEILKLLDLFFISFDNVDVRGIDFRGCNAFSLNPQTVYRKDLTNTKFDLNDGIFLGTTDFKDVDVSNMIVENSKFSLVSFAGSTGKIKKINLVK